MTLHCNFPKDSLATMLCQDLTDAKRTWKIAPGEINVGYLETHFVKVGGKSLPRQQRLGINRSNEAQEVYQRAILLGEKNPEFFAYLQGKLEIPWIADDLDPSTLEDKNLRDWIEAQGKLIREGLIQEARHPVGSFAYQLAFAERFFQALIRPQSQDGFGLSFDPVQGGPQRSLRDVFRQRLATCFDFSVLFMMAMRQEMPDLEITPIYLYQHKSGDIVDHLRIGIKNPATGTFERMADIQYGYFGALAPDEIWAPVSKVEVLVYYYNLKAAGSKDPKLAEAYVDLAINLSPKNYLSLFNKAFFRLQQKDWGTAQRYLLASIAANPNYRDSYNNLFFVAKETGQEYLRNWALTKYQELSPPAQKP
ncbi:MAG: hypothetical protein U1F66_10360 [bacterium]